jgi:hypothetical protein
MGKLPSDRARWRAAQADAAACRGRLRWWQNLLLTGAAAGVLLNAALVMGWLDIHDIHRPSDVSFYTTEMFVFALPVLLLFGARGALVFLWGFFLWIGMEVALPPTELQDWAWYGLKSVSWLPSGTLALLVLGKLLKPPRWGPGGDFFVWSVAHLPRTSRRSSSSINVISLASSGHWPWARRPASTS